MLKIKISAADARMVAAEVNIRSIFLCCIFAMALFNRQ